MCNLQKFGVDYVAFSKMAGDCPLHFLHLTFICCQVKMTIVVSVSIKLISIVPICFKRIGGTWCKR